MQLLIAEDLVLLCWDDETGKPVQRGRQEGVDGPACILLGCDTKIGHEADDWADRRWHPDVVLASKRAGPQPSPRPDWTSMLSPAVHGTAPGRS